MQTTDISPSQVFFTLLTIIPSGLLLAFWCVGRFIWAPACNKWSVRVEEIFPPTRYSDSFPISKVSERRGELVRPKHEVILETTPQGQVCMRYNIDIEAYEYWSDKSINYLNLETIARKYAFFFDCSTFYINRRALLVAKLRQLSKDVAQTRSQLAEKQSLNPKDGADKAEDKAGESVFAVLKDYRRSVPSKNRRRITRKDMVVESANTYIRKGRLDICPLSRLSRYTNYITRKHKDLTFADWKANLTPPASLSSKE